MANYFETLGMTTLGDYCGAQKGSRTLRQRKAIRNIKYATDSEWQFVNSWYDTRSTSAQDYFKDPQYVFNSIYNNSITEYFDEGMEAFGPDAEAFVRDVRFCGKEFLQKVCFFYLVKLMDDAVVEVELTQEEQEEVLVKLQEIKKSLEK